jgi:hypothetical protein
VPPLVAAILTVAWMAFGPSAKDRSIGVLRDGHVGILGLSRLVSALRRIPRICRPSEHAANEARHLHLAAPWLEFSTRHMDSSRSGRHYGRVSTRATHEPRRPPLRGRSGSVNAPDGADATDEKPAAPRSARASVVVRRKTTSACVDFTGRGRRPLSRVPLRLVCGGASPEARPGLSSFQRPPAIRPCDRLGGPRCPPDRALWRQQVGRRRW